MMPQSNKVWERKPSNVLNMALPCSHSRHAPILLESPPIFLSRTSSISYFFQQSAYLSHAWASILCFLASSESLFAITGTQHECVEPQKQSPAAALPTQVADIPQITALHIVARTRHSSSPRLAANTLSIFSATPLFFQHTALASTHLFYHFFLPAD